MKRISIDNGNTFCTVEEAIRRMPWETIVNLMDDEAREATAAEYDNSSAENNQQARAGFLRLYLAIANDDLIIG